MGDLKEGFNQIENERDAMRKMAVVTPSGQWLPRGLTFGPTNGPEDFQEAMYIVFSRRLLKEWFLFIDDLAVATGRPRFVRAGPTGADDLLVPFRSVPAPSPAQLRVRAAGSSALGRPPVGSLQSGPPSFLASEPAFLAVVPEGEDADSEGPAFLAAAPEGGPYEGAAPAILAAAPEGQDSDPVSLAFLTAASEGEGDRSEDPVSLVIVSEDFNPGADIPAFLTAASEGEGSAEVEPDPRGDSPDVKAPATDGPLILAMAQGQGISLPGSSPKSDSGCGSSADSVQAESRPFNAIPAKPFEGLTKEGREELARAELFARSLLRRGAPDARVALQALRVVDIPFSAKRRTFYPMALRPFAPWSLGCTRE